MTTYIGKPVKLDAPEAFEMAKGLRLPEGSYDGSLAQTDDGRPQPRYLLTLSRDDHAAHGAVFLERNQDNVTYDVTKHVESGNLVPR